MAFTIAFTVILAVLALFQVALALGAPLGRFAWGGQHRVLPRRLRIASLVTLPIYGVIDLLAWNRLGVVDLVNPSVSQIAMWVVFGYFVLGVVMNAMSRSKAERQVMVPVALLLAVLALLIAAGMGHQAVAS